MFKNHVGKNYLVIEKFVTSIIKIQEISIVVEVVEKFRCLKKEKKC